MGVGRTRFVSFRAAVSAALIVSVGLWAGRVAGASAADGSPGVVATDTGFNAGPSNPAPPFPTELVSHPNDKPQLPAVPMPQDRAADSYRIYSVLMPVGALGNPGWPRQLWLLADTTLSLVPTDQPCLTHETGDIDMNPHVAIDAPVDRKQEFAEMLEDFDLRCHERIQLTTESFNLVVPLKLISQTEQDEFVRKRFDPNAGDDGDVLTARYKGAPGLSRFTEVYFNAHHTLAMVYANAWCGGLCVQSYWQVLELKDGSWQKLPWRSTVVMN